MYEYKCIETYPGMLGLELTRMSKEGWELVGQPIMKDDRLAFATVRRTIVN